MRLLYHVLGILDAWFLILDGDDSHDLHRQLHDDDRGRRE
jgi:hypothetical protein